jgi:hypothetical protein
LINKQWVSSFEASKPGWILAGYINIPRTNAKSSRHPVNLHKKNSKPFTFHLFLTWDNFDVEQPLTFHRERIVGIYLNGKPENKKTPEIRLIPESALAA